MLKQEENAREEALTTDVTLDPGAGEPVLRFARRFPHPVERVWAALTEPAQMGRWFPCEVEADLRVGGLLTLRFPGEEPDVAEITELEPPHAIAFRWAGEHLRWTVEPDGEGCVLRLANSVLDPAWTANIAAGWHRCLEALAAHLDGRELVEPADIGEVLVAHYREALLPGS